MLLDRMMEKNYELILPTKKDIKDKAKNRKVCRQWIRNQLSAEHQRNE